MARITEKAVRRKSFSTNRSEGLLLENAAIPFTAADRLGRRLGCQLMPGKQTD